MLFATLIISFISLILLINLIFDIRCTCRFRNENNIDSESSDENFIPTQESSDEQEEEETKESFKVDCVEHCSKSCLCKTEAESDDDMPPLVSMNKTEQESDDDVPPLVSMNETEENVPSTTESGLREQIIN